MTKRRGAFAALWLAATLLAPDTAQAGGFTLSPFPTSPLSPAVSNTKLGVGIYGGVAADALSSMGPALFLIQDPDVPSARALRAAFPRALIVGRHFVPDGDPSLANCQDPTEPHQAKGGDFGQIVARMAVPLKGVVDAWVGDNEQASSAGPESLACHAQFELGFVQRLQGRYGIAAVVGNDASGAVDPQDYAKSFAQPISQAAYFGLHAYGKPGAASLQTPDSSYYALRYRLVHDALVQAGVPLPKGGFLLTETGLYDGWHSQASAQSMAADVLWLEQQIEQDDYVRGQMVFGFAAGSQYQNFELQNSALPQLLGAYNAQHAA